MIPKVNSFQKVSHSWSRFDHNHHLPHAHKSATTAKDAHASVVMIMDWTLSTSLSTGFRHVIFTISDVKWYGGINNLANKQINNDWVDSGYTLQDVTLHVYGIVMVIVCESQRNSKSAPKSTYNDQFDQHIILVVLWVLVYIICWYVQRK